MIDSVAASIDALNCGNFFSAVAMILVSDRGDRELAARALGLGRRTSGGSLEHRHVRLVELRDVRNGGPGVTQVLGGLAPDAGHRLALDLAPLGEVGQRGPRRRARARRGRQRAAAEAAHDLARELFDVFFGDAPAADRCR